MKRDGIRGMKDTKERMMTENERGVVEEGHGHGQDHHHDSLSR